MRAALSLYCSAQPLFVQARQRIGRTGSASHVCVPLLIFLPIKCATPLHHSLHAPFFACRAKNVPQLIVSDAMGPAQVRAFIWALLCTPVIHLWLVFLDAFFGPGSDLLSVSKKLAADQLLFRFIVQAVMFAILCTAFLSVGIPSRMAR